MKRSNCGGNSAALVACKTVAACFRVIGSERGNQPVEVTSLSAQERAYFEQVAGLNWLGGAKHRQRREALEEVRAVGPGRSAWVAPRSDRTDQLHGFLAVLPSPPFHSDGGEGD